MISGLIYGDGDLGLLVSQMMACGWSFCWALITSFIIFSIMRTCNQLDYRVIYRQTLQDKITEAIDRLDLNPSQRRRTDVDALNDVTGGEMPMTSVVRVGDSRNILVVSVDKNQIILVPVDNELILSDIRCRLSMRSTFHFFLACGLHFTNVRNSSDKRALGQ